MLGLDFSVMEDPVLICAMLTTLTTVKLLNLQLRLLLEVYLKTYFRKEARFYTDGLRLVNTFLLFFYIGLLSIQL